MQKRYFAHTHTETQRVFGEVAPTEMIGRIRFFFLEKEGICVYVCVWSLFHCLLGCP